MGSPEDLKQQVYGILTNVKGEISKEAAETDALDQLKETIRKKSEDIIARKGNVQPPVVRDIYVRRYTPPIPIEINGVEYGLSLNELVDTTRATAGGEEVALVKEYRITLNSQYRYETLFTADVWNSRLLGDRGERLRLDEAKQLVPILDFIDANSSEIRRLY